jgi:nucleotide-binding universal stress UspA family protein
MSHTVLAILAEAAGALDCLDAAREAAAALLSVRLSVLHVRVDPDSTIVPSEEILTPRQRETLLLEAARDAAALHALFVEWRSRQPAGLVAEWHDVMGPVALQVTRHGRAASLIVMAAPGPHPRGHAREAFYAALFDTQRPLLRMPLGVGARTPRRIVIGWKDSAVCRRAVTAAAPWLRQAEAVDVLHVVVRGTAELDAAGRLLGELGIRASLHPLDRKTGPVGEQLLAEAAAHGADWLVIGAFRRPPLAEWLLGGVTRVVLQTARLPVFLMH